VTSRLSALRVVGAASGVLGSLALAVYFNGTSLVGWPQPGASPSAIASFAGAHQLLFFGGAWLQVTGSALCVVFFLALVRATCATDTLPGLVTIVAAAALLSTAAIEAVMTVAVPMAAAGNDLATVSTAFALTNGVFVRVFPMAPASGVLVGLGAVVIRSRVMPRGFAYVALGLGLAFEFAGLLATVSGTGVAAVVLLSIVQDVWVLAAALAFGLSRGAASESAGARPASPASSRDIA
jgi:hypothetical protein